MKYFLIAGEASGELHGSNLMRGIKKHDPDAAFEYFGGELMQAEGGVLRKHFSEMAFMGIWEVLMNLGKIRKNFKDCKNAIEQFNPDALILIDYAGFNLRMARFAKKQGIRTLYYIAPKVWAWKKSRIKKIRQFVDHLFVIFPFEVDYFRARNYAVEFLGNPTFDALDRKMDNSLTREQFLSEHAFNDKPIVALLAGSRKQEIDQCLPVMTEAVKGFTDYQFVVAGAPSIEPEYYKSYLKDTHVAMVYNRTYDLLRFSEAAVVTSGTATLETALLNIPQVVMYKTSAFNYYGFKHVVKIPYFSLVNIIAQKEVVKELLQVKLVPGIRKELKKILEDDFYRAGMLEEYSAIRASLGGKGSSERTGKRIVEIMSYP